MYIAQCAVHIGLVLRLDMRHAALVVIHRDCGLQVTQLQLAVALRLLAVDVPVSAGGRGRDDQSQGSQGAFHGVFLVIGFISLAIVRTADCAGIDPIRQE